MCHVFFIWSLVLSPKRKLIIFRFGNIKKGKKRKNYVGFASVTNELAAFRINILDINSECRIITISRQSARA